MYLWDNLHYIKKAWIEMPIYSEFFNNLNIQYLNPLNKSSKTKYKKRITLFREFYNLSVDTRRLDSHERKLTADKKIELTGEAIDYVKITSEQYVCSLNTLLNTAKLKINEHHNALKQQEEKLENTIEKTQNTIISYCAIVRDFSVMIHKIMLLTQHIVSNPSFSQVQNEFYQRSLYSEYSSDIRKIDDFSYRILRDLRQVKNTLLQTIYGEEKPSDSSESKSRIVC